MPAPIDRYFDPSAIIQAWTSSGNLMVRQPLRLQHSQKQIAMPAPQFGKLWCAQTGKKQHVAGGIVAKEYALTTIEGEKMSVPATQES